MLSRQGKFIGNPHFEKQWISFIPRVFTILRKTGAEPPFAFALTLLDVRDYSLYSGVENPLPFHGGRPLNRRDLNLPILTASQFNQEGAELMRPAFDALWNACGLERCFNYTEQGTWSPRRWG